MIKYETMLMIFRRDLRLIDNTCLIEINKVSKKVSCLNNNLAQAVIPLFILSKNQLSDKNKYRSSNAIQFMIESLIELDSSINDNYNGNLWVFYGDEITVINNIYSKIKFDAIYFAEDYTPYSLQRDLLINNWCISKKIVCNKITDILLLDTNN